MIIESSSHWQHFQARFTEWLNAFVLLGWGSYLIVHPGMFTDPRVSALWAGLNNIAAQGTWGLASFAVGFARAFALYINGSHKRTPLIRLITSFISAFVWTQVVLALWKSDVPNTGLVVYAGFVVADIYSAFRASADVTTASQREREGRMEIGRVASSSRTPST